MTNQGTNQENVHKQDLNKGQSSPSQSQGGEKRFSPDNQVIKRSQSLELNVSNLN